MLDFIYYPVSWILWVWHRVFGAVLGPDNGFAWALSVVFLVFTLRILLYKPFVKQVRTTRQMQELQPQIKALQKKYGKDKQRMAVEMQKLQKEHGFNPIMGCLPVLAQAPVFIGLFHVLRSFNRTGTGFGQLGLTPAENRELSNYAFSVEDVNSFLDARLFGAPISAMITSPQSQLEAYANPALGLGVPSTLTIALVSIPLMIIAAIATHMNSRASVARQSEAAAANPQSAIMNKLALYVFLPSVHSCLSPSSCTGSATTPGHTGSNTWCSARSTKKRLRRSRWLSRSARRMGRSQGSSPLPSPSRELDRSCRR